MSFASDLAEMIDDNFDEFGVLVSYQPASGAAADVTAICQRVNGSLMSADGIILAECDAVFKLQKTEVATKPPRGSTISYGGETYDMLGDASQDAARLTWIITAKRRS